MEQQIPQPITFSEYLPKEWFKQADSEEEPEILSCNTITVNIDFESARANVTQSPLDSEKAMIQAARIDNQHAQVTIALRGINVPADLFVPEKNLLRHPYPAWVDRVPQGYEIPHFDRYPGVVGCPRRHQVLFLARCGTAIRSQSLLLRQFPLSLREDALDWYFNLPSRSISSWDVLAFYRAFYASGAIHIDMREWEEYENETVEDYDLFEGESDQILELALDQR